MMLGAAWYEGMTVESFGVVFTASASLPCLHECHKSRKNYSKLPDVQNRHQPFPRGFRDLHPYCEQSLLHERDGEHNITIYLF